jgi:multidrug transporter EmrE-like cation transporter
MKPAINPQILAGAVGILFASEPFTPKPVIGMGLTVGGIVVLSM